MERVSIPAEHLFSLELNWLDDKGYDFMGPFGPRSFRRAAPGAVMGRRFDGQVLDMLATDHGRMSLDGKIRHIDAYVAVEADDGDTILLQIRGRMSPRYGDGASRLQILITAGKGRHEWLGERQAVGVGRTENGRHVVEVYALEIAEDAATPDHAFEGRLILRRQSQHNPNAKHRVVASPFGARYLSVAESGGEFAGPRIRGTYPLGYAWSPHRLNLQDGVYYMHHDVNTVIQADDGTPILMSYTGLNSPRTVGGAWRSAVLFEAPEGPHAWLNEVFAIGMGKATGGGAEYHVYDFD